MRTSPFVSAAASLSFFLLIGLVIELTGRFKRQKRRLIDGENDSVLTVALLWPGLIAGFTAKHWRFDVALFLLILPVILGALAVDRILS